MMSLQPKPSRILPLLFFSASTLASLSPAPAMDEPILTIEASKDGAVITDKLNVLIMEAEFDGDKLSGLSIHTSNQFRIIIESTSELQPHRTYDEGIIIAAAPSTDPFWKTQCECGTAGETTMKIHDLLHQNEKIFSASLEFDITCQETPEPSTCHGKVEWAKSSAGGAIEMPTNRAVDFLSSYNSKVDPDSIDRGTLSLLLLGAAGVALVALGFLVFHKMEVFRFQDQNKKDTSATTLEEAYRQKSFGSDMDTSNNSKVPPLFMSRTNSRRESDGASSSPAAAATTSMMSSRPPPPRGGRSRRESHGAISLGGGRGMPRDPSQSLSVPVRRASPQVTKKSLDEEEDYSPEVEDEDHDNRFGLVE